MLRDDPELRREIETAIGEAVARFGMAGEALIEGDSVRLVGAGPEVSTETGNLVETWSALAPELRQRRATEIARRLVSARRSLLESTTKHRRGVPSFVAPTLIVALAAGALYFAWLKLGPGAHIGASETPPAPSMNADAWERDRVARAERVCEATRSRILRGATVGPSDVEGWVVEIALVRAAGDPASNASLGEFLQKNAEGGGMKLAWNGAKELSSVEGVDTDVEMRSDSFVANGAAAHVLHLTFRGKYVKPFFDAGDRAAYLRLANALADKLHADLGALYARCALATTHHMGAWFLGADPGAAVSALVYWMGAFNDPPYVRQNVLFPDGGEGDLATSGVVDRIRAGAKGFDRVKVRGLLSDFGGMISNTTTGPAVITFPFADANRAARASLELARVTGVGIER